MSIDLYDASVPVFLRYLDRLASMIAGAESHARGHQSDASALLVARLAPDMLPLESQVAIAAHFALRACFPLAGQAVPPFGDFPSTFGGLHSRIERVVSLLGGLERRQFAGSESRVITSQAGNATVSLAAPEFLLQYALPNFFFHLSAAYAILRNQGVPLGKQQFDGFHAYDGSHSNSAQGGGTALTWSESIDDVDWNELAALYRAAPLGNKNPQGLKTVFTNSLFRCFVRDEDRLVGVGRALADGVDCSYICDVALLPTHQGLGLGKQIVATLVERSRGHRKIILYAVPGKEPFYKKLGFKRMTTAMAIFDDQALALEKGYVNET